MSIKVKVCGMREKQNIAAIASLEPDYMGFIFYSKSKRFAPNLDSQQLQKLPTKIKKVGVFVNAPHTYIEQQIDAYSLDYIQLHGQETPEFCHYFTEKKIQVIKAFSIAENFDFDFLANFENCYFLFDTKGKLPGGNGVCFNWHLLQNYHQQIPFFLSGGVDLENIKQIEKYPQWNLHSVDINSKFEIKPGLKDVSMVQKFCNYIRGME